MACLFLKCREFRIYIFNCTFLIVCHQEKKLRTKQASIDTLIDKSSVD